MKPFSLLIKPASADCNIRCEYCFYYDHSALYPETKVHRMSDAVVEKMIGSYMQLDLPHYGFGWQGGEPTLMGEEFFKKAIALQQKYGAPGTPVSNGLQTNAVAIGESFAQHLADYNYLLGVSLDGPPEIHDAYRKDSAGRGTHARVLRTIELLRQKKVAFNILTLVNDKNVSKAKAVYRYLRDRGFHHHQYIPCVEFAPDGSPLPFTISGRQWGTFLCEIFDQWYPDDIRKVSIRFFDSIVNYLVTGEKTVCTMGNDCRHYLVVEYNGDIYPCDFFVRPELKLGNIMTHTWESLLSSPLYREFGERKSRSAEKCRSCKYIDFCQADCLKHRWYAGKPSSNLSWLCEGLQTFFDHTLDTFRQLADDLRREQLQQQRGASDTQVNSGKFPPVGRNELCPCGSGLKYKKCCMNKL
jgi:uncharacterized protein